MSQLSWETPTLSRAGGTHPGTGFFFANIWFCLNLDKPCAGLNYRKRKVGLRVLQEGSGGAETLLKETIPPYYQSCIYKSGVESYVTFTNSRVGLTKTLKNLSIF